VSDQPEEQKPTPQLESGSQPPTKNPQSRSGCLTAFAGSVGCVVLLAVIIGALILLGVTSVNSVIGGISGLFGIGNAAPPPIASILSSQTIVQGIQPLGQLVSVSAQLAKADVSVSVGQGALNACGFSANHVVQGAVEAGIDLTQIDETDIRYDAEREVYVLTVPAPQVTSCRVDYIRQYDRSFTTCSVDWDEARLLANYQTLIDFRDDAVEGGLLTRAEIETRVVLGNFLRLLTGHPVEIIFETPETPIYPPSCVPAIPQGWRYDDTNGHWTQ